MQKIALLLISSAVLAICFSAPAKQVTDIKELLAEIERNRFAEIEQNQLSDLFREILPTVINFVFSRLSEPSTASPEPAMMEQESPPQPFFGPVNRFFNRLNSGGSSVQVPSWEDLTPQEQQEAKLQQNLDDFQNFFQSVLGSIPRQGRGSPRQAEEMSRSQDADRQLILDLIKSKLQA